MLVYAVCLVQEIHKPINIDKFVDRDDSADVRYIWYEHKRAKGVNSWYTAGDAEDDIKGTCSTVAWYDSQPASQSVKQLS